MIDESFFDESSEQSRIKSRIVTKYFLAWAKVIIPSVRKRGNKIAYVDLFSGPGLYKDGTGSTPVLVLQRAIADQDMREMLVTVFNDKSKENIESLREVVDALPGIQLLGHRPRIQAEEIGAEIVKIFERVRLVPTLFFVDPWGYKGLSLGLFGSVLKDWGCDCVFFFNYNRINMALENAVVREHMNAIFGEARAERIRGELVGLALAEREDLIIEELSRALQELGAKYVLPFCFKNEQGTRTSHHLIFATKDFKGYEIMKEIMAGESSDREQGVPSFGYSPPARKSGILFALSAPLDDLGEMLLKDFAGETLTMEALYLRHNVGRPYIRSNYKKALKNLEAAGKIRATPRSENRPKRRGEVTFADNVVVEFPGE